MYNLYHKTALKTTYQEPKIFASSSNSTQITKIPNNSKLSIQITNAKVEVSRFGKRGI